MISGNYIFGLHGLIWSTTVAEVLTCLVGLCLWIKFNRNTTKIDSDLDFNNCL